MHFHRRAFLAGLVGAAATAATVSPAAAAGATQEAYSLANKARWRSFGVEDWVFHDPYERSKPGAIRLPYSEWTVRPAATRTGRLLDLIAFAEAGRKQYDAIHMSARRLPRAQPTQLSIDEIKRWIRATPGQHHAIGRYQFIPSTLAMLVRRAGLPGGTRFTPAVQDRLAMLLLKDAGYDAFASGRLSRSRFQDNLAWIWAGLPLANGHSAYRGVAGNRATISRRFYDEQMHRIFA